MTFVTDVTQRLTELMRTARCSRIRGPGNFKQPMAVPLLEFRCRIYPVLYLWKSGEVYYNLFARASAPSFVHLPPVLVNTDEALETLKNCWCQRPSRC